MTSILDIAQWSLWKWPTPRYLHLRQTWCHFPCRSHRLLESQPCQPRSAVCGDAGCVASLPITPWSIASLLASTSSTNVIWICLQLCIMSIYIYGWWSWFESLWKILVSWDDYSQYMEKHVPNLYSQFGPWFGDMVENYQGASTVLVTAKGLANSLSQCIGKDLRTNRFGTHGERSDKKPLMITIPGMNRLPRDLGTSARYKITALCENQKPSWFG